MSLPSRVRHVVKPKVLAPALAAILGGGEAASMTLRLAPAAYVSE